MQKIEMQTATTAAEKVKAFKKNPLRRIGIATAALLALTPFAIGACGGTSNEVNPSLSPIPTRPGIGDATPIVKEPPLVAINLGENQHTVPEGQTRTLNQIVNNELQEAGNSNPTTEQKTAATNMTIAMNHKDGQEDKTTFTAGETYNTPSEEQIEIIEFMDPGSNPESSYIPADLKALNLKDFPAGTPKNKLFVTYNEQLHHFDGSEPSKHLLVDALNFERESIPVIAAKQKRIHGTGTPKRTDVPQFDTTFINTRRS